MTQPPPPAELAWLTDVIGAEAALVLIEKHGGTRLYIPKEPNQGTPSSAATRFTSAPRRS